MRHIAPASNAYSGDLVQHSSKYDTIPPPNPPYLCETASHWLGVRRHGEQTAAPPPLPSPLPASLPRRRFSGPVRCGTRTAHTRHTLRHDACRRHRLGCACIPHDLADTDTKTQTETEMETQTGGRVIPHHGRRAQAFRRDWSVPCRHIEHQRRVKRARMMRQARPLPIQRPPPSPHAPWLPHGAA